MTIRYYQDDEYLVLSVQVGEIDCRAEYLLLPGAHRVNAERRLANSVSQHLKKFGCEHARRMLLNG